jgi:hypothetical protein
MKKRAFLVLVTGFAATSSASAMAASLQVASNVTPQTNMTYADAGNVSAALTGGAAGGVGSLIVSRSSGAQYICSGALLTEKVVITAGHCLSSQRLSDTTLTVISDPVLSVNFYLPSYVEATPVTTFAGTDWWVPAAFSPSTLITTGNDLALFSLASPALGYDTYDIYTGDPFEQLHLRVGTGTVGDALGTFTSAAADDFRQRLGINLYELFGSALAWSPDFLLYDFDDGTADHDAFYQIAVRLGAEPALIDLLTQPGVFGEASASPGDSGGPQFINGQIVSVTSFGISTDALLGGNCGTDSSIDPYGAGGAHGNAVDQNSCTNSSVGEIAGDTWLLPHAGAIQAYIQSHSVPEPATWAQMVAGFGLLGGAMRRIRRRATRAAA